MFARAGREGYTMSWQIMQELIEARVTAAVKLDDDVGYQAHIHYKERQEWC